MMLSAVRRMGMLVALCAALASGGNAKAAAGENNLDLVFAPAGDKNETLAEKMFVLIPGANVPTSHYDAPAHAIQAATNLRLWVVVPQMPSMKCIEICPHSNVCFELQRYVQAVVAKAVAQGYRGSTAAPDVFLGGHSMGSICAGSLGQAYAGTPQSYAAAVVMGGYTPASNVAAYPLAVLTLGAELDGGLARPGVIQQSLVSSDKATAAHGGSDPVRAAQWQLSQKPVAILPGLDHSSFCPGFRVPGDVFPADVDNATALHRISGTVAAFLHLRSNQTARVTAQAQKVLSDAMGWTRSLLQPLVEAQALEVSGGMTEAPWCARAQQIIAGLREPKDAARLAIANSVYKEDSHQFEHTRVRYFPDPKIGGIAFNVSGHNQYYQDEGLPGKITDACLVAGAKEIGCKLASSDRVAQQLNVTKRGYDTRSCLDVNKEAFAVAQQLLAKTAAGAGSLARYHKRGRPMCFGEDFAPVGNIGPLWVSGSLRLKDNGTCLVASSLAINTQLNSLLFPGVNYCKLLSPARAMDYIMIDALKPKSGCLNHD